MRRFAILVAAIAAILLPAPVVASSHPGTDRTVNEPCPVLSQLTRMHGDG